MKPIARGKHVYIRAIMDSDFPFIHQIFGDIDSLFLWTNKRECNTYDEFIEKFKKDMETVYRHFYIVCTIDTFEKIGFIYSYNAHSGDGYVYTSVYLTEKYRQSLFGAEAGLLYYCHLFRYFNYRKIYSEVYDYNRASNKFLISAAFSLEGKLKKHRYYNGKFYDLNIYAVYREEFLQKYGCMYVEQDDDKL